MCGQDVRIDVGRIVGVKTGGGGIVGSSSVAVKIRGCDLRIRAREPQTHIAGVLICVELDLSERLEGTVADRFHDPVFFPPADRY